MLVVRVIFFRQSDFDFIDLGLTVRSYSSLSNYYIQTRAIHFVEGSTVSDKIENRARLLVINTEIDCMRALIVRQFRIRLFKSVFTIFGLVLNLSDKYRFLIKVLIFYDLDEFVPSSSRFWLRSMNSYLYIDFLLYIQESTEFGLIVYLDIAERFRDVIFGKNSISYILTSVFQFVKIFQSDSWVFLESLLKYLVL